MVCLWLAAPQAAAGQGLQADDIAHLRSVGFVRVSPDAKRILYNVTSRDRPGVPYSQTWLMEVATRRSSRFGPTEGAAGSPRWSGDGRFVAYFGSDGHRQGLMVADGEGNGARFIAPVTGTNHPLPSTGEPIAFSPDGRQIAFVSAVPGPEPNPGGDPAVITRYLYKPTHSGGAARFNDNRRLHLFVADVASGGIRQLTDGPYHDHSPAWAPGGERIAFISNREPDADRVFNNDIFVVRVADGSTEPLTHTQSAEYAPAWSPDGRHLAYLGTRRPLTSSETTMEDTHVWLMDAGGGNRRDMGESVDNRQDAPQWSADGKWIYFSAQQRGSTPLFRVPAGPCASGQEACKAERVMSEQGALRSWSLGWQKGTGPVMAYALATPRAPADLFVRSGAGTAQLTAVNRELLSTRTIARVEPFVAPSFDGTPIEAFLTRPAKVTAGATKHPMIVIAHGGPHAQEGPTFNVDPQIYAARGWASLLVNYRGSTGYGQKIADGTFADQNGAEAKDVLALVDAALHRYPWLDPDRMGIEGGSYGGQLTNWIITRTTRFKAAIPVAGISNLVTQNYLAYYHDYLPVEFGAFPHEKGIVDQLWERSPVRFVNRVKTPTMLVHGENDNDVPIEEAEQFYIALKDVGVETTLIRYPREGHGVRETSHVIDLVSRKIAWYEKHFAP